MTGRDLRFALVLALATGCGGETITVGPPPAPAPAPTTAPAPSTVASADDVAGGPAAPTPLSYPDSQFVEADTNRDPFRSYTSLFVPHATGPVVVQRHVIMEEIAVDEMHLIAIVSGVADPTAMLMGGDGVGHTVHRGDFVGRVEIVQTGGEESVPVSLNWRVERIREDAIVLSREDPTAPNRPPLTREIPLHDPSEQQGG